MDGEDLEASFLEFLDQGNLRAVFDNIPAEELDQTIENLNRLFAQRLQQSRYQRRRDNVLSRIVGFIPLPVTFRLRNIHRFLLTLISSLLVITFKVIQIFLILSGLLSYFKDFYRIFIIFGELFTFSDNVVRDLSTFIFRNHQSLLLQNKIIHANKGYFYINDSLSNFQIMKLGLFNIVAESIQLNCHQIDTNPFLDYQKCCQLSRLNCKLNTNSLLFKFANVVLEFFPILSYDSSSLTWFVLAIFFTYASLGEVVGFRVLLFFLINLFKRLLSFKDVYIASAQMIWKSFGGLIA